MKKTALFLAVLAAVVACKKNNPEEPGIQKVTVADFASEATKLFVLNEGGMGTNNASLDVLTFAEGSYKTNVFRNLGDVGNDIAVQGDEVWMVINNSGIVEVLTASDQEEIAAIQVPTPRNIAFDADYAYVTSWAGAYVTGSYDEQFNYSVTDYSNPKGQVYRINLKTKEVAGSVEVGYQPEGLAVSGGKLYVANSGGISSQLPPSYAYDNTVSVIDTKSFTVTQTMEVQVNLKNVYADTKGNIYVTTLGNYYDVHSGLYWIAPNATVTKVADYVSTSCILSDTVYCIGTEEEFNWDPEVTKVYKAWKATGGQKANWDFTMDATVPYGLFALNEDTFFVADAVDYKNPGIISCFHKGEKIWGVTAGVCPGHFAKW